MTTSVAIVGLGSMGKNHLRVISALPDAKVIGVLDHAISQELLNTKLFASLNDFGRQTCMLDILRLSALKRSHE